MAAARDDQEVELNDNLHFNISCHGANTGKFFKLPANVKIMIPSEIEYIGIIPSNTALHWKLNCMRIDANFSNIKTIVDKMVYAESKAEAYNQNFKIYDGNLDMNSNVPRCDMCPIIEYSDDDKLFYSGIAKCPVTIKKMHLIDKVYKNGQVKQTGSIETIGKDSIHQELDKIHKTYIGVRLEELYRLHSMRINPMASLIFPMLKVATIKQLEYSNCPIQDCIPSITVTKDSVTLPGVKHNGQTYVDAFMIEPTDMYFADPTLFKRINIFKNEIHAVIDKSKNLTLEIIVNDLVTKYPNSQINIIAIACNRLPKDITPQAKAIYMATDKGIMYDEYQKMSLTHALSEVELKAAHDESKKHDFISKLNETFNTKSNISFNDFITINKFKETFNNLSDKEIHYGIRGMNPERMKIVLLMIQHARTSARKALTRSMGPIKQDVVHENKNEVCNDKLLLTDEKKEFVLALTQAFKNTSKLTINIFLASNDTYRQIFDSISDEALLRDIIILTNFTRYKAIARLIMQARTYNEQKQQRFNLLVDEIKKEHKIACAVSTGVFDVEFPGGLAVDSSRQLKKNELTELANEVSMLSLFDKDKDQYIKYLKYKTKYLNLLQHNKK